jgi:hypothetical protein
MNSIKIKHILLGIDRRNSNSSDVVRFISVFHFILREDNRGRSATGTRAASLSDSGRHYGKRRRVGMLEMGSQYPGRGIDLQERPDEWYVNERAAGISVCHWMY